MIIGVGVDVCHVARFQQMLERRPGIATRILTPREAARPVASQAARFAAKEALAKALGSPGGMSWQDCEIINGDHGRPEFVLRGTVAARLQQVGGSVTHLSLSHDAGLAIAYVIVERP